MPAAVLAWVSVEQVRGSFLGGFTFGGLGHTQWRWTTLIQCADAFGAIGVSEDVERAKAGTHIRAGRGKMRGRRHRMPRGPLLVVRDVAKVRRGFGNLPGVEVASPASLNAEVLAPGGQPGRLVVFSSSALEALRGWSA